QSFDLVTSRHPVAPQWSEIARVLQPGGHYFAQHVGPLSVRSLSEFFVGPLPGTTDGRDPAAETKAARAAGLSIADLRTARCRVEFFDVGAVVYILRKCVWWVPEFSVERYRDRLLAMHEHIEREGSFVTHSTRHLIDARR
ncbi:MAG TPA: SAM-dependent methyltransferase, partial [Mycobacteriales bacterium]|nr:SAM-dependent methyltransferase [Mycobacteriales bacterium]